MAHVLDAFIRKYPHLEAKIRKVMDAMTFDEETTGSSYPLDIAKKQGWTEEEMGCLLHFYFLWRERRLRPKRR